MKISIGLLFSDAKDFLCNATNRVLVAVTIVGVLLCYFQYRTENKLNCIIEQSTTANSELLNEIRINRKKINFRYFNLTKSLEEIHKVEINTRNGKLEND